MNEYYRLRTDGDTIEDRSESKTGRKAVERLNYKFKIGRIA